MKKKWLIAITGILLTAVMLLAGCKLGKKEKETEADSKGEEVTEKVWNDALELLGKGNLTAIGTEHIQPIGEDSSIDLEFRAYLDVPNQRGHVIALLDGVEGSDSYVVRENGVAYSYNKENGVWQKNEDEFSYEMHVHQNLEYWMSYIGAYKDQTFDAATGSYSWSSEGVTFTTTLKDGKFRTVKLSGPMDGAYQDGTITFSDYGTTKIVLPTVGGSDGPTPPEADGKGEQVTEKVWNDALELLEKGNLTMTGTVLVDSGEGNPIHIEEKAYLDLPNERGHSVANFVDMGYVADVICARVNGVAYCYQEVGGVWQRVENDAESIYEEYTQGNLDYWMSMIGAYKDQTFDAATGSYSWSSNGVTFTITLKDGKFRTVKLSGPMDGAYQEGTITFSDYGTTKIELPTV